MKNRVCAKTKGVRKHRVFTVAFPDGRTFSIQNSSVKTLFNVCFTIKTQKTFNERDIKEDDEYKRKIHF